MAVVKVTNIDLHTYKGSEFCIFGNFYLPNFDNIIENNAAYLARWLKILKEYSKLIFKAAAEAQKAADYVLNRRQSTSD